MLDPQLEQVILVLRLLVLVRYSHFGHLTSFPATKGDSFIFLSSFGSSGFFDSSCHSEHSRRVRKFDISKGGSFVY